LSSPRRTERRIDELVQRYFGNCSNAICSITSGLIELS
jgi:hypothetical protein